MSYSAIASTNPYVKSVNRIEYISASGGSIIVVINHTIYIGKFPNLSAAETAVNGLLVKCGCSTPTSRRSNIPTTLDSLVLPYPAFANTTSEILINKYPPVSAQIFSTNSTLLLLVGRSNTDVDLWYKISPTQPIGNTLPSSDGYTAYVDGTVLTVPSNYWLGFKGTPSASITGYPGTTSWSLTNKANQNIILDTFSITVDLA